MRFVGAVSTAAAAGGASTAVADEHDENGPLEGVPTAGDFPEGETVGLQLVADGLPAPTDIEYAEVDDEVYHFLVTQTGQIFVGNLHEMVDANDENGENDEDEENDNPADEHDDENDEDVAEEFVFDGVTPAWVGQEPDEIDGTENPTLELEEGETYRVTWTNGDGEPHNFVILDEQDNIIERTEIISEQGEEQTFEFEATGEMNRYICEVHPGTMDGAIRVVDPPEAPEGMELFMDISDRIIPLGIGELGNYDERGLFSMAAHPDFAENRTFYVRYSAPERHGLGYDHTDVLAEFQADEEFESADPETERTIMEVPQPQDNHNGGPLAFGPDGHLFVAVGDGGNVHDIGLGHVQDWYDENEGGNAQDTTENLLGGIHRIEVDPDDDEEAAGPQEGAYEIPEDNPLADTEFLGEFYAWGFRNPWGMTIDDDGTIFATDAGQHLIESAYVVEEGGNYSWNVKEGSFCFSPETPLDPPEECPDEVDEDVPDPRGGEPLLDPIAEYQHMRVSDAFIDSSVVVGGHRYAGEAIPELDGHFVFANWSSEGVANPDGEVLVAIDPDQADEEDDTNDDANDENDNNDGEGGDEHDDEMWELEELQFAEAEDESLNRYVYGIERDEEGELYVLANTDFRPFPETGEIYRIVPEDEAEEVPAPEDPETVDPPDDEDEDEGENGEDEENGNEDDDAGY